MFITPLFNNRPQIRISINVQNRKMVKYGTLALYIMLSLSALSTTLENQAKKTKEKKNQVEKTKESKLGQEY